MPPRRLGWLLLTCAVAAVFVSLGCWQLRRADEKSAWLADWDARSHRPAVDLATLDPAAAGSRYRRVELRGEYRTEHEFLLLNRMRDGRVGIEAYTPFVPAGGGDWLLVNRGWYESPQARPKIHDAPPAGVQTIRGLLAQPANPGLRLGTIEAAGPWPQPVVWLDAPAAAHALGHGVLGAVLLLDAGLPGGFVRDWHPDPGEFGPERHRGYALQWFALTATVVCTWIVLSRRQRRRDSLPEARTSPSA